MDLFAGCGGLTLGFHLHGFNIAAAIEVDKEAMQTYANNLFKSAKIQELEIYSKPRDITQTKPVNLLREFGISELPHMAIDIILGGPPCQAFARVGRAKLREYRRPSGSIPSRSER
ncbi:DNA cytosine methyltransferase [Chloroflexota bacterium]